MIDARLNNNSFQALPLSCFVSHDCCRHVPFLALRCSSAVDFEAAFEEAENDDRVLCAVLTGAGRYFCSGADVLLVCFTVKAQSARQCMRFAAPVLALAIVLSPVLRTGRKAEYSVDDPPRVQQIKGVLSKYDPFDSNTWSDVNMYEPRMQWRK